MSIQERTTVTQAGCKRGEEIGTKALEIAMRRLLQIKPAEAWGNTSQNVFDDLYAIADLLKVYRHSADQMTNILDAAIHACADGSKPGECWLECDDNGVGKVFCKVEGCD